MAKVSLHLQKDPLDTALIFMEEASAAEWLEGP